MNAFLFIKEYLKIDTNEDFILFKNYETQTQLKIVHKTQLKMLPQERSQVTISWIGIEMALQK